ncbi:hypothetical protein ACQKIW_31910 [Bacillus thuringiensis]|uniref:hypothetical protein n=1 Tax=Bacillus thuringiensis TaxID=1428 RepID=UPI003D02BF98
MNKGDAILKLLSEVKLELKKVREPMEKMQTKLDTLEQVRQANSFDPIFQRYYQSHKVITI